MLEKRVGTSYEGSADAAAGVGNGNAPSAVSKAQRRASSRANKKAKTGEPGVLWSPGKGKGPEDRASLDTGGGRNGDVQNLSVLAKNFKERYGEEVDAPDDDDDGMTTGSSVFETPKRKGRLSGGAKPRTPVEEAARSMSPARLAAEAQKARARAREERFGGGGGGGGGSFSKPPSSPAPSARPFPVGEPPDAPLGAPPPAAMSKVPMNRAAGGHGDKNRKGTNAAVTTTSSQAQQPQGGKGIASTAAPKDSTPANGPGGSSNGSAPTAVSPMAAPKGATSPISATNAAAAVPALVTPDAEKVDASAASKTGSRAAAITIQAEAIPMDETPAAAATSAAAPKRPAAEGGNVAAAEPPVKKVLTLPSSQSPPSTGGKIHTLRLRLRTDLVADSKQPAPAAPSPATAAGGGAEERKSFEPPTPPADGGVEECKGFDPPNLPKKAATVSSVGSKPSPVAAPSTGIKKPSVASISTVASAAPATTPAAAPALSPSAPAPLATATTPTAVASRLSIPPEGSSPRNLALTLQGSWGPSFGIPGAPAGAPPPTPASSPDVAAANKTNPWILSPESPTFGRNRGRPLAQAFPKPSQPTRGSSSSSSSSSSSRSATGATRAAGLASATRSAGEAASVQPDSRSSSGGCGDGGIREGRALRGNGTPATPRPAGTTPCRASPQGGTRGADVANSSSPLTHPLPRAGASAGMNAQPPLSYGQSGGLLPPERAAESPAAAAAGGGSLACWPVGSALDAAAETATGTDAGAAAASGGFVVLGVRMGGKAAELLERLKREREESLDFERKLTQALMDL
ncbi:unnamed protein product [Ectocarpus sp. CCAP 1310/34]|nr:unnamed protein product [Ectocarpus sp. CCAP 1310/34]